MEIPPETPNDPSPQQEAMEKMVFLGRGPRGERGETGEQGARGEALNSTTRRALVYMFGLFLIFSVAMFVWTIHSNDAYREGQTRQNQAVEHTLCFTFEKLDRLRPPPGNPKDNPSRAYLQEQHALWAQLGHAIGC